MHPAKPDTRQNPPVPLCFFQETVGPADEIMIHPFGGNCKIFWLACPLFPQNFLSAKGWKRARRTSPPRPGVNSAASAAAAVVTAAVVTAAVVIAVAAAAEQDDDEQDDPQAAAAAPPIITAPHI